MEEALSGYSGQSEIIIRGISSSCRRFVPSTVTLSNLIICSSNLVGFSENMRTEQRLSAVHNWFYKN